MSRMQLVIISVLALSINYALGANLRSNLKEFPYDDAQAEISVWLSAAAYCGRSRYMDHEFKGPTTGFVVTNILYHAASDNEGYVGYLPSDESIYVVFRGSYSIRNWIADLDVLKTDYTTYPECNCQVHKGFFDAEQSILGDMLNAVKALKTQFPSYAVKTTGHSLGAAQAQLAAMDLTKEGYAPTVYNFGQPRVGDQAYSVFATQTLPTWRVTHHKDIVPHIPFTDVMDFYHACSERYEDGDGVMHACDSGCEDPSCANQYELYQTDIRDHLFYLGIDVTSCHAVSE